MRGPKRLPRRDRRHYLFNSTSDLAEMTIADRSYYAAMVTTPKMRVIVIRITNLGGNSLPG